MTNDELTQNSSSLDKMLQNRNKAKEDHRFTNRFPDGNLPINQEFINIKNEIDQEILNRQKNENQ
jgi:hypothetical protein